jgi:kynurenine formamidase
MKPAIAVLGVAGAVALAGASGNAAAQIAKNVAHLPTSYAITAGDRQVALNRQGTTLHPGDAVLVRTGVTAHRPELARYRPADRPGLSREAAQWLVDAREAMVVGAHNAGVESFPSKDPQNVVASHTCLQAEQRVSSFEALWLEHLSKDQVCESLFIAFPLKLRGATASPLRPVGIPIQRNAPEVNLQA